MEGTDFLQIHSWKPLAQWGFTHPFFTLNFDTILNTWLILGTLALLGVIARWFLHKRPQSILSFMILAFVRFFKDMTEQTLGAFKAIHFYFGTSLFIFLFFCNCITLLPFTEEPTQDLNTTLAMGIISFLYIQIFAIKTHGIAEYLKEYIRPLFIMMPLHVISKISSIISLSFRLFGNIFGGAVISRIYLHAIKGSIILESVGLLSGLNILISLFFTLFEGTLQAFVFAMLSLTYLSLAINAEEEEALAHIGDIP